MLPLKKALAKRLTVYGPDSFWACDMDRKKGVVSASCGSRAKVWPGVNWYLPVEPGGAGMKLPQMFELSATLQAGCISRTYMQVHVVGTEAL